ncbi:MAG: hypothetical protein C3F15_15875 [Holophagae bacterium]|nr:MAG: hypothetical protein C3F15_15875 [Holophagae bacterium]
MSPCDSRDQQPSITLTLSAEEAIPGDQVTLSWRVRPRVFQPGQSWWREVALSADFMVEPGLPANPVANSGSHTFVVPEGVRQGRITLATWCGDETVSFRVPTPASLYWVTPDEGAAGAEVRLRGTDFGDDQGESRVELTVADSAVEMEVVRWTDEVIDVRVPEGATRGEGSIRLQKSGRLASEAEPFRVLGARVITNQDVQDVAELLGLDETAIRLHRGDDGCTVDFSPALNLTGVDDVSFDGPELARAVGNAFGDLVISVLTATYVPKRVYYSLNDFNSDSVRVALDGAVIEVEVGFESAGKELIGELEACWVLAPDVCERTGEFAPDVDLDDTLITLRAALGLADGRIRVTSLTTRFEADVRLGGGGLDQDLVEAVTEFSEERVRDEVEEGIDDAADTPEVRRAIADALMDQLELFGIQEIRRIAADGDDLRVEYE